MKNLIACAAIAATLGLASTANANGVCYYENGYSGSPRMAFYYINYCDDNGNTIYGCYGVDDPTGILGFATTRFAQDDEKAAIAKTQHLAATVWTDGWINAWSNYHCSNIGFY